MSGEEIKEMYDNKKVLCGLSAGINSAAVLVWLANSGAEPEEVHLYYAHFNEHSPDSLKFVLACVDYAKSKFKKVVYVQTDNSIIDFFEKSKMIPHPANSPCSRLLKIEPMAKYLLDNKLDIDIIGYVKEEKRRATKMKTRHFEDSKLKNFPILSESNEWCFEIVDKEIGWHPEIYDIRWNDNGFMRYVNDNLYRFDDHTQKKILKKLGTDQRVFKHNNCLPCKNMYIEEMLFVEYFYAEYMKEAKELSERLKKYWGRDSQDYYTVFGREDYEKEKCEFCQFD